MKQITLGEIPKPPYEPAAMYFFPAEIDAAIQREMTDRTRGWFKQQMIDRIMRSAVAIAGAGGMGGHLDDSMVRACIRRLMLSDSGFFDRSNIHRQYGANLGTVGAAKTFATADMLRNVSLQTEILAFMGISSESVMEFLAGADVCADSIEYHAIGARCLLHHSAKEMGVPVMNGNSVGFGTNISVFKPDGPGLMDALPFDVDYAYYLEGKFADGTITEKEYQFVGKVVNAIFLPVIPNYGGTRFNTREAFLERLLGGDRTASIITTNPKMAAGLLANQILLFLVEKLGFYANVEPLPVFPEYYHYDAAFRVSENRLLNIQKIRHELSESMPCRS